jgi:hypothetical protein
VPVGTFACLVDCSDHGRTQADDAVASCLLFWTPLDKRRVVLSLSALVQDSYVCLVLFSRSEFVVCIGMKHVLRLCVSGSGNHCQSVISLVMSHDMDWRHSLHIKQYVFGTSQE